MDQKDRARHSVAQTREHLALVAEELARRASMDWVKDQAQKAATNTAKDAIREMTPRPMILAAVGAGLGAVALFAILRSKKKQRERDALFAPYYHAMPMRSPNARTMPPRAVLREARDAATEVLYRDAPRPAAAAASEAPKKSGAKAAVRVLREGGREALTALGHARVKQSRFDRMYAPLIGTVVVIGAAIGAVVQVSEMKKSR